MLQMQEIEKIKKECTSINKRLTDLKSVLSKYYFNIYNFSIGDEIELVIAREKEYGTIDYFDILNDGNIFLRVKVYESLSEDEYRWSYYTLHSFDSIKRIVRKGRWENLR